jgi:chemotaxis protein MotB
MAKKHKHPEHVNHERWLVSYADFITLLFATFTALYALSRSDADKSKIVAESMRYYFGSYSSQMLAMQAPASIGVPSDKANPPPGVSDTPSPKPATKEAGKQQFEEIKQQVEEYLMTKGMLSKVQVDMQERGLVISLKEAGFFGSGNADLKPEAAAVLAELAQKLKQYRNPVRVEGHTDNVPIRSRTYPSNWELSSSRATNVARQLIEKFGVPANKISATGYGDTRPAYPNADPQSRARNRRVDLVILTGEAEKGEPEAPAEESP